MQLTVAAAFLAAAASLTSAQSVPGNAPGCVKYCLRIAREQTPSACTWAGWCNTSGFQDNVSNCYNNICGATNRQVGAQIYQQICSSAGSNTECPTSGGATQTATSAVASASSAVESVTSSAASEASSATATTSDLITTTIGGVATTFPASYSSSIAAELSSSAAGASSAASSVSESISSAVNTATAPVSSAISSILGSASSAANSASSAAASATSSAAPNAGVAVNLPSHGQIASIGAILLGAVAGAFML